MLNSYKELLVWNKSVKLTEEIYRLTSLYPKEEIFGITSQSRRAVVAIPSNIAEGYSRKTRTEYCRFVNIAFASAAELETQLIIAKRLKMTAEKNFEKSEHLLNEVQRMLKVLELKLRSNLKFTTP